MSSYPSMAKAMAKETARPLPWQTSVPVLLPTLAGIACLASLLLLVQLSGVTATGYDLRQLEETRADWERNNILLESYIADLQSLDRIEHQARERLRMIPATGHTFVRVSVAAQATERSAELPPRHAKRSAAESAKAKPWESDQSEGKTSAGMAPSARPSN